MKDLNFCILKDFYGSLLTATQQEMLSMYYEQDMSLFEIAEIKGISRQAVRDSVKTAEAQLTTLEEKLGLNKKQTDVLSKLDEISRILERDGQECALKKVKELKADITR